MSIITTAKLVGNVEKIANSENFQSISLNVHRNQIKPYGLAELAIQALDNRTSAIMEKEYRFDFDNSLELVGFNDIVLGKKPISLGVYPIGIISHPETENQKSFADMTLAYVKSAFLDSQGTYSLVTSRPKIFTLSMQYLL